MLSNYLSGIEGVAIYPVIGLFVFLSLFVFIVIRTIKADKKYIHKMENLPLENDKSTTQHENKYEN